MRANSAGENAGGTNSLPKEARRAEVVVEVLVVAGVFGRAAAANGQPPLRTRVTQAERENSRSEPRQCGVIAAAIINPRAGPTLTSLDSP